MSDKPGNYGILLNKNLKLHRHYFKQMVKLIGIYCEYYVPLSGKTFSTYADLNANYAPPVLVGVIFQEHPDQKTLKKMGWVAELQENSSIIHVPYDLPGLQYGALFSIPSGLDDGKNRLFRVISMQNVMVYPASIACEIAPEYADNVEQVEINDFTKNNFNVLVDNEEDD